MRAVAVWFAGLAVATAATLAQSPPPTSVTQVIRTTVKPGMTAQYEAGRKKHMAWHKQQADPWTWNTSEVMTGPQTGDYLTSTGNHQWKDFDSWLAKYGDGDTADSAANVGPHVASTQVSYWTLLPAVSKMPASGPLQPMFTLTIYQIKPGSDEAILAALGKLKGALDAGYGLPLLVYRLSNGGTIPSYALVSPRGSMADMDPQPSMQSVVEKALGKAGGDALVKAFFDNVVTGTSEMLVRRADLSYAP